MKVLEALEPMKGAQAGSDDIQVTLHYRVVLSYVFVILYKCLNYYCAYIMHHYVIKYTTHFF